MLTFCDFIQVYVFSTNHHLNCSTTIALVRTSDSLVRNASFLAVVLIHCEC